MLGNIPVTLAATHPILVMLLEVLYLRILRVSLNGILIRVIYVNVFVQLPFVAYRSP